MDLDIVRKIKLSDLKARFRTLALKHKLMIILVLISFTTTLVPHETYAAVETDSSNLGPALVYNSPDNGLDDYLETRSQELSDAFYQEQIQLQVIRHQKLTEKVQSYLTNRNSPLAEYTETLVTLRNWKKIVALANAESTLCRHYPESKSNCWGVGGSNLWDMGENLGQGVISMNHFLNKYPMRSPLKYSQMSFDQMNGLYKQPATQHWVVNNETIYEDLAAIEQSI